MKNIKLTITIILLLVIVAVPVYASSNYFSFSFNTGGNGSSYSNGSYNGVYHSLSSGSAYLSVDSTTARSGSYAINVDLRKSRTFIDANYGSVLVTGSDNYKFPDKVGTSSIYYLVAYGNGATYYQHSGSGTLHN